MNRGYMRERRPDVFELRAYVSYDPNTGKRHRLHATFRGTREEAEAALRELVARADAEAGRVAGLVRKPREISALTVADAAERWFEWALPKLEPATAVTERDNLDRYLLPRIGDVELWRLRGYIATDERDADHDPRLVSITDFYVLLAERGGRCMCPPADRHAKGTCPRGGALGPSTVRRAHTTLRSLLKFATSQAWIAGNPAVEARLRPVPRRKATTPRPETLARFLHFLATDRPALLAFAHVVNSGSRRVDGLGLQWGEVDFDASELVLGERGVVRALDAAGPRITVVRETATTKRRRRRVAMSEATMTALRRHRQVCLEAAVAAGVHLTAESFVFSPAPDGSRPYRPGWASTEWGRARRPALRDAGITGLERVRLYDVRHFFATYLLAAGVKEVEIAQLMGNSPSTMRYHYASAISLGGREAAAIMDGLLGKPRPTGSGTARKGGRSRRQSAR